MNLICSFIVFLSYLLLMLLFLHFLSELHLIQHNLLTIFSSFLILVDLRIIFRIPSLQGHIWHAPQGLKMQIIIKVLAFIDLHRHHLRFCQHCSIRMKFQPLYFPHNILLNFGNNRLKGALISTSAEVSVHLRLFSLFPFTPQLLNSNWWTLYYWHGAVNYWPLLLEPSTHESNKKSTVFVHFDHQAYQLFGCLKPVPQPALDQIKNVQYGLKFYSLSTFGHQIQLIDRLVIQGRCKLGLVQMSLKIEIHSHLLSCSLQQFILFFVIIRTTFGLFLLSIKSLKSLHNLLTFQSSKLILIGKLTIKFILFRSHCMEKLLTSRKRQDEEQISVGDISPQKYGKSAFCNLQYTPSKLVDNVLFKEVTTLKKVEQQSSKTRQFEAINDCLMDKLKYMQEQKNVIINSLNQQIIVYKRIIKEMQGKNEDRIKDLQRKFKEELTKIILSKEEEVKFVQSERELLENKIGELQREKSELQEKINTHDRSVADLKHGNENLQKQVENLNYKLKEKGLEIKDIEDKNRADVGHLQKRLLDTEMIWKEELRETINRKDVEIHAIENSHKLQIEKYEELRKLQTEAFKKQTNDIIHSYEQELKKLSQILQAKEKSLQALTRDHRDEKSKNLLLAKTYETQLGDLTNLKLLNTELESQNEKLRDLLIESSKELERCRQQFLILDKQNSVLRIKVKSSQQEARTWRENYYKVKR